MPVFLSPLLEPLGAIWFLMILGVVWLSWKKQWRSVAWLGVPMLLIWLLGGTPLVETLVAQAERPYAESAPSPVVGRLASPADVVIALGGGYYPSEHDLHGIAFSDAASRVLTAVEVVRRGKARHLVLGGSVSVGRQLGAITSASVQSWAQAWGVAGTAVTNLGLCANTHDEAVQFCKLRDARGWRTVILVTSALHLKRSEAAFRKQGITVIPMACDFRALGVPDWDEFKSVFPRQGRFDLLAAYLHERIGWWVYRWRGWV